jgi:hypothetical protein
MDDCRILWGRYSLAMERRQLSETAAEQAAWWAEANEWLGRYFDAVDRQLERDLETVVDLQPAVLKLVAPRLTLLRPEPGSARFGC